MIDWQLLQILLMPMIAGVGVAVLSGPLGAFVVWRRMAYFGDTLAHAALLGVALGVVAEIHLTLAMIIAGLLLSVALWQLQQSTKLANDTLLGILSHSALALGLICVSLLAGARVDLFGYLFGSLLTVSLNDILAIYLVGGACLGVLIAYWRPLLLIAIDEDLAKVEAYPVAKLQLLLMLLIAMVVALSMKLVGILLITALLIIPAATARRITSSPEAMAVVAAVLGAVSVLLGLLLSALFDLPAGPAIVLTAALGFLGSLLKRG